MLSFRSSPLVTVIGVVHGAAMLILQEEETTSVLALASAQRARLLSVLVSGSLSEASNSRCASSKDDNKTSMQLMFHTARWCGIGWPLRPIELIR